jgi:hypothetical protein
MKFGYNIPIFFEDCSNPITLKYVNHDIVENYKISSNEILKYDGSLLKTANVELNDLKTTINLDLNILTQDNQLHVKTLNIEIPLADEKNSIFDGSFEKSYERLNLNF